MDENKDNENKAASDGEEKIAVNVNSGQDNSAEPTVESSEPKEEVVDTSSETPPDDKAVESDDLPEGVLTEQPETTAEPTAEVKAAPEPEEPEVEQEKEADSTQPEEAPSTPEEALASEPTVSEDLVPPGAKQPESNQPDVDKVAAAALANASTAKPAHERRNNKKFGVVMVLVIALVAASVAIFVYVSTQDNTNEDDNSQQNQQPVATEQNEQTQPAEPATDQDVDDTINNIDQTIESIDDSDLSEDSLSDQSLGL